LTHSNSFYPFLAVSVFVESTFNLADSVAPWPLVKGPARLISEVDEKDDDDDDDNKVDDPMRCSSRETRHLLMPCRPPFEMPVIFQ
jgi:hypothetical protein